MGRNLNVGNFIGAIDHPFKHQSNTETESNIVLYFGLKPLDIVCVNTLGGLRGLVIVSVKFCVCLKLLEKVQKFCFTLVR